VFEETVATLLQDHLDKFLHQSFLGFAYESQRVIALQRYLTTGDFQGLTRALQKKNFIEKSRIPKIIKEWKEMADLGLTPYIPDCGHALHFRCASRMCMKTYSIENAQQDKVPFASLPKVPRWKCGDFQCPVCRHETSIRGYSLYDENLLSDVTLGPYRLSPGALVWIYDHTLQPGHPEAGSLGRLLGYTSGGRTHLKVEVLLGPQKQTATVHVSRVFDVAFLLLTGIPSREQVGRIGGDVDLLEDDFALFDASAAADSSRDGKWQLAIRQRKEYVDSVFKHSPEAIQLLHTYLQTGKLSGLICSGSVPSTLDSVALIWKFMFLPRLGMVSQYITPLHPTVPSPFVPFQLLEKVHRCTGYSLLLCNTVLRYAAGGFCCNGESAVRILDFTRKLASNPANKAVFESFRLPVDCRRVGTALPDWAQRLELCSEHEVKRIQRWCSQQFLVAFQGIYYLIHADAPVAPSQSPACSTDSLFWLQTHTTPVPELATGEGDYVFSVVKVEHLPLLYRFTGRVKAAIDELRESAAAYPSRNTSALISPVEARARLESVRTFILEKHQVDVLQIAWFDLSEAIRRDMNQYLNPVPLVARVVSQPSTPHPEVEKSHSPAWEVL